MEKSNWVAVAALVLSAVAISLVLVGGNQSEQAGELGASGTRFPNGISADSTSPSAGQVRGTTFTATGGISGSKICIDNGSSSYSIIDFAGNTTSTTITTSTSCQ